MVNIGPKGSYHRGCKRYRKWDPNTQ